MFRHKASRADRVQEKAAALADEIRVQAREAGLEARADLETRAGEVAGRVRESEAFRTAQAKGADLAAQTREKMRERHLDEKAAEAAARAQRASDRALERAGGWLAESKAGEKLHVAPAKRGFPGWLAALLGIAVGYGIGLLAAPKRGGELRDDLAGRARELRDNVRSGNGVDLPMEPDTGFVPADDRPLADKVRTALGESAHTRDLPTLNINVVEGTVFVRGAVPSGYDEGHLRMVIASVDGVTDVDLQVKAIS